MRTNLGEVKDTISFLKQVTLGILIKIKHKTQSADKLHLFNALLYKLLDIN